MISTFNEWLNESESNRSTLTFEELEHIQNKAIESPEYDEEEDEFMAKIVAEYLEEIKATDPLSKKYLEFWNKAVESSDGDEQEAIYLINDIVYDPPIGGDKIDPKIEDMISYPLSIEATPGPGVTYDDVSIAIKKLGEYRAQFEDGGMAYCPYIRAWVPGSDYYGLDRPIDEIVGEYEEIVLAIRNKDYLWHLCVIGWW